MAVMVIILVALKPLLPPRRSPKHTHMNQPLKHIHTSAASPPSPPHALSFFEVEFRNLPNTHKRVYHANFVA